ncbi:NTE family protein [Nonlabens dokdonensis]|jgi:NTE family protein|uniref:NTE family protein n=2 Tax=Nonlabens dokdonensis TaxID=328515 RepID=A0ABX5Q0X6_9FLAO|nr:patatin-like phospholipase family protein [Nonlabens dokdonensis]AGC76030.1 putative patatin-like phospholipase [Nonlabens dokdonensis DSW-6]PZX43702.1 NTE family protein [Nonlabens dokdonensis]
MRKSKIILLFIVLALAKADYLLAQQNETSSRPKIGLVLSGGGAKGLAHIGTLKIIDSLGIKIDYIAGTSMGAIIGSSYASGYTGKQLDSIFKTLDFDKIISDDIPRSAKTFFERRSNEKYAITLPFKDFQVQIPSSLSKGQNIYDLLSGLLYHVKDIDDFSELPIPFLCIATDITTGEEVVLDSGYLPKAVNASGALPSLFAPVDINGKLLIDGGVTDNYPIQKLRDRGMDIIIGVDVQDDLKSLEELDSALDILSQINNFRTINDMKEKAPETDVYIMPDISSFSVVSFEKGREIIKKGELAARRQMEQLKALSATDYQKPELQIKARDSVYINDINVDGNNNYTRAYIVGRFKVKTPGKIAYDDINIAINNLQASDNFAKINYEIIGSGEDATLNIEVVESDVRNYLRLGLHYDELLRSAALINLSRKNVLFNSDIISADVIVGDNLRYNFDYYIDKGRYWSIGIHSEFLKFQKDVKASLVQEIGNIPSLGVNNIDLEYRDWTQQLYVQTRINKSINFISGAEIKTLDVFTETLTTPDPDDNDITDFSNGTLGSIYGKVLLDSYDNAFLPSSGWRIDGDFHLYLFNTEFGERFNEFSMAQLQVGRAQSFGNLTLRGNAHIGITIGDTDNSAMDFFLGGYGSRRINNLVPFFGYDFISAGGDTIIKALFEIDYEIFKKNHIIFSSNFASVEDNLFETKDWFTNARYTGYAIGYGMETFLGPIEVKYTFSPQQDDGQVFVNLGFRF